MRPLPRLARGDAGFAASDDNRHRRVHVLQNANSSVCRTAVEQLRHNQDSQGHILAFDGAIFEVAPAIVSGSLFAGLRTWPQNLSHTMYKSNGLRKSTAPQNRQPIFLTSNSKQQVDDFVGE